MRPLLFGCFFVCFGLVQGCNQSQSDSVSSKGTANPNPSLTKSSPTQLDPQSAPGGRFGADNSPDPGATQPLIKGIHRSKSGLQWQMIRSGTGDRPKPGQQISIHYEAKIKDGAVYDSTKGKSPLTFPVGRSQLNRGMEEGVMDMSLGEKRVLTIPPKLAYGATGVPGLIPPDSTLEVTVEIVGLLEEE